jgi:metallo-beta-lactamase class B
MQAQTGAEILASPLAAPVLESGVTSSGDPQAGTHAPMEPVVVADILVDGVVTRDIMKQMTPIQTPGHSPGALSWTWESCEGENCLTIAYADSLSPVSRDDYKFSDHPEYLAAYEAGLERLAYTECDILLTPHPSHSRMIKRMRYGNMRQTLCAAYYATGKAQDIEKRLTKEGIPPDEQ